MAESQKFYRIGQVSRLTGTKSFVLRYWETEFPTLQPGKTPSGHRLYRPQDVELVLEIRRLLYDEGFTIAGARRHLRSSAGNGSSPGPPAASSPSAAPQGSAASARARKLLLQLRDDLRDILTLLERG